MTDKVALCITSYNRYETLRACIGSFVKTNVHQPVELIIVDNASTDHRIKDYVDNLQEIYGDAFVGYKAFFRQSNDYPLGQKEARNKARSMTDAQYFIDCPDDHLFVVCSNWIDDGIELIEKNKDLVGCIVHYAQPMYRFAKKNNEMQRIDDHYYVSLHKGYADYHLMSRYAYERIGKFNASLGQLCESDYMSRALELGFRRVMMRYPVAVINAIGCRLTDPIDDSVIVDAFSSIDRPVSNEELFEYLQRSSLIEHEKIDVDVNAQIGQNDPELDAWLKS